MVVFVVENALGPSTEEREGGNMSVTEGLGGLGKVCLHALNNLIVGNSRSPKDLN